ncbi:MAG TPA: sigma factor [Candidatus Solibacter sp.]|jgi:DNA-directed RNA polymerase sigma subunit (sigma70/sigma32)|nr:sigma factor [Candidatus Solibacter sp.]
MPDPTSDGGIEQSLRRQAGSRPVLAPEAEKELLGRLPDPGASRDLVEHNLDLVVTQAERHEGRGLSFADLYQEGTVGLLDALGAYQGQGTFRDFASLHIGLQMDSLLEAEGQARTEAEQNVADCRSLDLAQVMFKQQNRRDATPEDLAELLRWDPAHVAKVIGMLDLARERNDLLTLEFLDDADDDETAERGSEPERDPRRQLPGHGPDE